MKYKIIVDKQSRTNPSPDKKEYEIDIEEIRRKGSVADSIVFTREEAYVMRRLSLSEYHVLTELTEPIKEPLDKVNIELFEGDNYIYVIDTVGNKFYAEYILDNEFNKTFATKVEMFATIETLADRINLELQKKVDGKEYTAAQILLMINGDISEAKIKADKLSFVGKVFDLTTEEMTIISNNFNVDKNGTTTIIAPKDNKSGSANLIIKTSDGKYTNEIYPSEIIIRDNTGAVVDISSFPNILLSDGSDKAEMSPFMGFIKSNEATGQTAILSEAGLELQQKGEGVKTSVTQDGITTPKLTQTSLKSKKKNIKKLKVNALELVKKADICEYNFKKEKKGTKKHIGLVIGEGYNCPEQVVDQDGQGVEQYSLTSLLWKAVQELTDKVE
ncbi:MAG: hypothetical protein HFJ30_00005, partial [Clostridia bacterium]|nr:hypothetical protein [Clostridia bacterium]MCI9413077.1 hypothetical protein [Clostridia bacterium]